jgi:hypothetical protein
MSKKKNNAVKDTIRSLTNFSPNNSVVQNVSVATSNIEFQGEDTGNSVSNHPITQKEEIAQASKNNKMFNTHVSITRSHLDPPQE